MGLHTVLMLKNPLKHEICRSFNKWIIVCTACPHTVALSWQQLQCFSYHTFLDYWSLGVVIMTQLTDGSQVLCGTISSGTFKPGFIVSGPVQVSSMAQVRAALAGSYLLKELKHTTIPIYTSGREFLQEGQLCHLVHKILLKFSIFSLGHTSFCWQEFTAWPSFPFRKD